MSSQSEYRTLDSSCSFKDSATRSQNFILVSQSTPTRIINKINRKDKFTRVLVSRDVIM